MQGPTDPRFGRPQFGNPNGVAPQQPHAAQGQGHPVGPRPQPAYGNPGGSAPPPAPSHTGQAQAYGQPPSYPPQAYGQPSYPPQAYGQPAYGQPPAQAYGQPPQPQPYGQPQQPAPSEPPHPFGHHVPSFGLPRGLGGALAGAASGVPQPSGLPAAVSFGLAFAAVLVALVFDVIFLKIHIPGVGSYAWYLTTALSFAGAGWASIMWTRASKSLATTAMAIAGVVYGAADLGLGLVLEDLSLVGAIILGAQGVAIAVVCGGGGVFKALRAKDEG